MINKKEFAQRLVKLRNASGLSQNRLASMLGVSGQAISKWENEHSLPDIDLIPLISNVLGTSIDHLLIGDKSQNNSMELLEPSLLSGYDISDEYMNLVSAMSDSMPRNKLFQIARLLEKKKIDLSMDLCLKQTNQNKESVIKESIDLIKLDYVTLKTLSGQIAKLVAKSFYGKHNLSSTIIDMMKCPKCGGDIRFSIVKEDQLVCENNHHFNIIDGVVDFGYREQHGNCWSFCYKTYDEYAKYNMNYDPYLRRSETTECYDVLIKNFTDAKPSIFIDAGTGEGMGIGLLLKEINWSCTAILTDLSHRILRYNKKLIEEIKANPYVNIIYLACDLTNIPLKKDSVDCVWSYAGFGNMGPSDLIDGVKDSYRVLKKDGKLIMDLYTYDDVETIDYGKWLELLYKAHPETKEKKYDSYAKKVLLWEELFSEVGFDSSRIANVRNMMQLPENMIFPWENQIMQWTGSSVASCKK